MIATTIEQSKKLLELSIDPSTADMAWIKVTDSEGNVFIRLDLAANIQSLSLTNAHIYPAWSLSALSEILKCCERCNITLRNDKQWNIFVVKDGNVFRSFEQRNGNGYGSQLDAYYDVVCWLKEHKFI